MRRSPSRALPFDSADYAYALSFASAASNASHVVCDIPALENDNEPAEPSWSIT